MTPTPMTPTPEPVAEAGPSEAEIEAAWKAAVPVAFSYNSFEIGYLAGRRAQPPQPTERITTEALDVAQFGKVLHERPQPTGDVEGLTKDERSIVDETQSLLDDVENVYLCVEPSARNRMGTLLAIIDRLNSRTQRLVEAMEESYQDNLYDALNDGVTGNGGKWWTGGMSTAEWFCRQAGIGYEPQFTKEELMARVPEIAKTMVAALSTGAGEEK